MSDVRDLELAVIAAAKNVFGMRTIDTDTGEVWRHNAVCTWNTRALYEAVSALEGGPPFIDRSEIRPPDWVAPAELYRRSHPRRRGEK